MPKKNKQTSSTKFSAFYAFLLLLVSHLASVFYNNISDCDETFNFWEPTHYLLYGKGFQTWEYSPTYPLRSYMTVLPFSLFGKLLNSVFLGDKIKVFYGIRCLLALMCSICETVFIKGVSKLFSVRIAKYLLFIICFSSGQFASSTAFLNSSLAMMSVFFAYGCWLQNNEFPGLLVGAMGVVLGWPFSGLAYIPMGLHCLYKYGILRVVFWFIMICITVVIPDLLINHFYYHTWTFPCLNIVLYNVLKVGGGSELYGVEPWSYYLKNLLINFNIIAVLAFIFPIIYILVSLYHWIQKTPFKSNSPVGINIIYYGICYIFMGIFFTQEHKEERFLYIIYPFIYMTAAFSLDYIISGIKSVGTKLNKYIRYIYTPLTTISIYIVFAIYICLSVSRIYAYIYYFHAPINVYTNLYYNQLKATTTVSSPMNICLGKEWHRYPASFFIPNNDALNVTYIESGFKGILPKPYATINGTFTIPTGMNTMNKQEMDRYIPYEQCDYIIDLHLSNQIEPAYEELPEFSTVYSEKYLDIENTPAIIRSLYIPSPNVENKLKWLSYMIIKKKNIDIEKTEEEKEMKIKEDILFDGHKKYFEEEL
ncbi:hypothetical protein WA158_003650 [Blastocystis sp. Blastoise]